MGGIKLIRRINITAKRVSYFVVIEGAFGAKVFINEVSCQCCSSSLGGVMLVQKRKVGLLASNTGRWGGKAVGVRHREGGLMARGGGGGRCVTL